MIPAAALLVGCAGVTDVLYGPDTTPIQAEDSVYQDAYAIGAMWAAKNHDDAVGLKTFAQALVSNMENDLDISSFLADAWIAALKKGDTEDMLMMFAVRRLYGRLGVTIDGASIDASAVDKTLLYSAAKAFVAGVQSQQ